MSTIAINARSFLNKQYTGIGRYAYNLVKSFSEAASEHQFLLYAQKGLFQTNRVLPRFASSQIHLKVDRQKKGIDRTCGSFDLYHAPSPEVLQTSCKHTVVTVHDLVYKEFPEGHTEETLRLTDEQFHDFIPRAEKIICCSKNTQRDLVKHFSIDESRVQVIHQGVDKNVFYRLHEDEMHLAKETLTPLKISYPFILYVGTIEPRKNLKNLLKAFAVLCHDFGYEGALVIVGMKGWKSEGLEQFISDLNIKDRLQFLGFVSDDVLRSLYNLTEAFVFPTFYEGFGFPLVEAFSCGAPVVTSNVSTAPEIVQDAALQIDPHDVGALARAIRQVSKDKELQHDLQIKGYQRSLDFSFEKTAQETLKVYEEVLKKGRKSANA
ncbi:MAG: glycosyltransferase family 4 protein [Candidatus Omnitrophica bacterium]|nr:glycosyltransferase family 4 protein [Candidatus Omnitrophota bacterium]